MVVALALVVVAQALVVVVVALLVRVLQAAPVEVPSGSAVVRAHLATLASLPSPRRREGGGISTWWRQ